MSGRWFTSGKTDSDLLWNVNSSKYVTPTSGPCLGVEIFVGAMQRGVHWLQRETEAYGIQFWSFVLRKQIIHVVVYKEVR